MPYQLTENDFAYFIPRHDQILQEDFVSLYQTIYPGAKGSGLVGEYTPKGTELILALDEREPNKNIFIGGILVDIKSANTIHKLVTSVKEVFRPEIASNEWMIKGSGEWVKENEKQKETDFEPLTRWLLWTKALKSINPCYSFHSATLISKKYPFSSSNKRAKNIEKYEAAFDAVFESLKAHKYANISIIIDNVSGSEKKAFYNSIEKSKSEYNINNVTIVEKDEFDGLESSILQFVDMQIYALSRFILPTGSGNILVDFEKYPLEYLTNNYRNGSIEKRDCHMQIASAKFHLIKDLYHNLRFSIKKNLVFKNIDRSYSSCSLLSRETNRNYGRNIDELIHSFCCNPQQAELMRTEEW